MSSKPLDLQTTGMIISLINYFTAENKKNGFLLPFNAIIERVAGALNISISSVRRIKKSMLQNKKLKTPGLYRPRLSRKSDDLDENIKAEVRNIIFNKYAENQPVSIRSLAAELATKQILTAHPSTIKKLLFNIGFKYKKDGNRRTLTERKNIALMRIDFFRKYMQNRHSRYPRQLVFVDETCIFDAKENKSSQGESNERKRFILLHAGTEKGFVPDVALVYSTKSKQLDSHCDMTPKLFYKWLAKKLIPNLEEPSLIIMDNAPYHSILAEKVPTFSWTKEEIQEWLERNNISFHKYMFKVELLNLVQQHNVPIRNKVDKVLQDNGHEILRLPPYHCQFNAIEMIWTEAKEYYYGHIGDDGYSDANVIAMWEQALQSCTPESWKLKVAHTDKVIEEWYNRERIIENIPEMIIRVGNNESEDESASDDEFQAYNLKYKQEHSFC